METENSTLEVLDDGNDTSELNACCTGASGRQ